MKCICSAKKDKEGLLRIRYFSCPLCGPELVALYGHYNRRPGPLVVAVVTHQQKPAKGRKG